MHQAISKYRTAERFLMGSVWARSERLVFLLLMVVKNLPSKKKSELLEKAPVDVAA
jgi:hypothetical protein